MRRPFKRGDPIQSDGRAWREIMEEEQLNGQMMGGKAKGGSAKRDN